MAKLSLNTNAGGRMGAEKDQRGKLAWGWKSFWKLACWWCSTWNPFCVCILDLIPDLVYFPVSCRVSAYCCHCCCCCYRHDLLLLWGVCAPPHIVYTHPWTGWFPWAVLQAPFQLSLKEHLRIRWIIGSSGIICMFKVTLLGFITLVSLGSAPKTVHSTLRSDYERTFLGVKHDTFQMEILNFKDRIWIWLFPTVHSHVVFY